MTLWNPYGRAGRCVMVLMLLVCLCVSHASALPPKDVDAIKTRLFQMSGTDFSATGGEEGILDGRKTFFLFAEGRDAKIDIETGILVDFYASPVRSEKSRADLTIQEAHTIAKTFVEAAGISLDGVWEPDRITLLDHGGAAQAYLFEWKRTLQGVTLPSATTASVDVNTRKVYSYLMYDHPVTIPLTWQLSPEAAVAKVVQARQLSNVDVEEAILAAWYAGGYPGRQVMMWRLNLTYSSGANKGRSRVKADVDANSGELLMVSTTGGRVDPSTLRKSPTISKVNRSAAKQPSPLTVFQMAKQHRKGASSVPPAKPVKSSSPMPLRPR